MRYLAEIVGVFAGLSVLAKTAVSYVKYKRTQATLRTAYFSGGQLDGAEKRLPELPTLVTHGEEVYRREHDDGHTAIYVYADSIKGDDVSALEIT